MKIVTLEEFLSMPANTVYCKYGDGPFGDIEVKTSAPGEWGRDWVVDYLNTYCDAPYNESCADMDLPVGTELRFASNQTSRDGLYEGDQLFCVFDNEDILRVIRKLFRCLKKDKV